MAGYSGTALPKKLGIKDDTKLLILDTVRAVALPTGLVDNKAARSMTPGPACAS